LAAFFAGVEALDLYDVRHTPPHTGASRGTKEVVSHGCRQTVKKPSKKG